MTTPPLPTAAKWVAWIFILAGVWAIIEILVSLTNNYISINLSVLCLPTGRGILRRRQGWRTFALAMLWLSLFVVPVVLSMLLATGRLDGCAVRMLGAPLAQSDRAIASVVLIATWLVNLWSLWVLMRSDVRTAFGIAPATPR